MIFNIIGYPGAGKSHFIKNNFNLELPKGQINDFVFNLMKEKNIFESSGINSQINTYLRDNKDQQITFLVDASKIICFLRIIKDMIFTLKINRGLARIKLLFYLNKYHYDNDMLYQNGVVIKVKSSEKIIDIGETK